MPPLITTPLDTERRVFSQPAQSESLYPMIARGAAWKANSKHQEAVPFRYFTRCFSRSWSRTVGAFKQEARRRTTNMMS